MSHRPASRRRLRVLAMLTAALLGAALVLAGCASTKPDARPTTKSPSPTDRGPVQLTFAVYGPAPVITAYTRIAADFTAAHPDVVVNVRPYRNHTEAMAALAEARAKGDPPDLFLMDHDDLPQLAQERAVRRVDDLLGERQIDFGDGYTRNGLEEFSADAALQCMPADVSPLVVYYNPRLINLSAVAEPGHSPVTQDSGWSLQEFARAASQPRAPGVRGLYIDPDLEQIAPFLWSGGGSLVDDNDNPTTLTLSDGSTSHALERLLEIVRDQSLTFGERAIERESALKRFEDGKLGMILGYRDLVPQLRAQHDFFFDVMPLPRLGSGASVGTMQGLCIASGSDHVQKTADFLAAVVSNRGARTLAQTGYAMPPNLAVLNSDAFLQPEQQPTHSEVFVRRVRETQPLPNSPAWPAVREATRPMLTDLFYQPVILPLEQRLEEIDNASAQIFAPESASPSPSPEESGSPSGSSGSDGS